MSKPNTICRVCGKEYFCCVDSKAIGSWRTMACSEEHFKEYIKRIEESRKPKNETIETVLEQTEIIEKDKTKKIKSKYSVKEDNEDIE